jgi:hypothetical protein
MMFHVRIPGLMALILTWCPFQESEKLCLCGGLLALFWGGDVPFLCRHVKIKFLQGCVLIVRML